MALWRRLRSAVTRTRAAVDAAARAGSEAFAEQLLRTPRYTDSRKLNHYELQMYSQNGEDGILAEIFRRVGATDRYFVEFGVENGLETNTTYLLHAGWRGLWVDGNAEALRSARGLFGRFVEAGALRVQHAFVTAENAAALLHSAAVPATFDLLSVDIDRNTWHLWHALAEFRPRVVVAEYNASVPPCDDWVIEYDPARSWNGSVQYGASLKAFERLGRDRGYALVGCNLAGVNAFFVREDLVGDQFVGPFTAEAHFEPPRYWLKWRAGHLRGVES
jgi:hypothetical protein